MSARADNYLWDALVRGDDPWTAEVNAVLYPLNYVKVRTIRCVNTVLSLYILSKHLLRLRDVQTTYLRLRAAGVKAAVGVRFRVYGVLYAFCNVHMSAHDWNLALRVEEYGMMLDDLEFPGEREFGKLLYHDYCFVLGDLNFRLREGGFTFEEISELVERGEVGQLLEQDQLRLAMAEGRAFQEFGEEEIRFAPTFKFKIGHQVSRRFRTLSELSLQ